MTSNPRKDAPAKTPENGIERIVFEEVDRSRWSDLERLFEGPGGPKNCWCMVWRASGQEARKTDGQSRKSGLKRRVDAGVPVGILGYLDGEPIAWCSVAPRETYRRLGGPDEPTDASGGVWSLVCFYIPRAFPGHGITRRLLGAAAQVAMRDGAGSSKRTRSIRIHRATASWGSSRCFRPPGSRKSAAPARGATSCGWS